MVLLINVSYVKIVSNVSIVSVVNIISNVSIVSIVNNVWFLNKKRKNIKFQRNIYKKNHRCLYVPIIRDYDMETEI